MNLPAEDHAAAVARCRNPTYRARMLALAGHDAAEAVALLMDVLSLDMEPVPALARAQTSLETARARVQRALEALAETPAA